MHSISGSLWIGCFVVAMAPLLCLAEEKSEPNRQKVLFFSQSFGFRHSVVARPLNGDLSKAEIMFKGFASAARYQVFFSQDYHDLESDEQFNRFDAIVFYTSQAPKINRDAFLKWLRSGKAFVGIHCATDSYYDWPEYAKLIGAQFDHHGPADKELTLKIEDTEHYATRMFGKELIIADEIYQFKPDSFKKENVHVLMSVDNSKSDLAPQKMSADKYYPVSWTNTEGKGRVFYTSLGHREEVWAYPKYQDHLLGGLAWALEKPKEK